MIKRVLGFVVAFHLRHAKLLQLGEGVDECGERQIGSVDQIIEVARHSSFEGVHYKVHLFLHHLYLYDNVRRSRVCDGRAAHVLLFWFAWALLPSGPSWSLLSVLYLLGFPLGSPLLCSFASVVPLGHDSVW